MDTRSRTACGQFLQVQIDVRLQLVISVAVPLWICSNDDGKHSLM